MDIKNSRRLTLRALKKVLPKASVFTDLIHRYAYARDAGLYRLLPQMVIKASTIKDIAHIFREANKRNRGVVFRAGGTSLSGQAISHDILVEVKQGWRNMDVLEQGQYIVLEPGVVAARANQRLEALGYRIGPDPGSIRSALIGGIVANNASGIGSGTHYNSYATLAGMEMVLPTGLVLNSANPQDRTKLQSQAPKIHAGLIRLRDQIRDNETLRQRIRDKYKLKNTMGYSLNSFLDYEEPLDILAHLMVGSEGTLGFISRVTLKTVPLYSQKATALIFLPSIIEAARLVPKLKKVGSSALEIMDDSALKAVRHLPGLPFDNNLYIAPGSAALLIEYQSNDTEELNGMVESAVQIINEKHASSIPQFFSNPIQRDRLWKIRRELGPHHAATRPSGTSVLSEDICFKVKDLARAIKDLQALFVRYAYDDAVIFGHAGDGNLHFKLSLDLDQTDTLKNYAAFMSDLVEMVVDKYDGSLKAEHGTGRNMAPFVEKEWGATAYKVMQDIKELLDPNGILNPDVLISRDDQIHLKNIKPIPLVDDIIDPCIECGLCEPICPSEDFTLTPRQRIGVLREVESLGEMPGNETSIKRLKKSYRFYGIDTCAVDGLCSMSCPVDIDTGLMMKQLRVESHGTPAKVIHGIAQKHFTWTVRSVRALLRLITPLRYAMRSEHIQRGLKALNKISRGSIPALNPQLKSATGVLPPQTKELDVIYFPSCVTRSLANPDQDGLPVADAFAEILTNAGIGFGYPQDVSNLCCGLSFSSKGYSEAALQAAIHTTEKLWISSLEGELPIVMDTSPCSKHLGYYDEILSGIHLARWRALKIFDMVEYLHDVVLEKLSLWHVKQKVVLHMTCSTQHMGLGDKMVAIAQRCAKEVIVPMDTGCCGFAGDRGLLVPGLTESATEMESKEIVDVNADGYYSTSRTCEMGMTLATDKSYQSLLSLVHEAIIKQSVS
ncbi:MAG: FAD-binding oxidoreductase [FCB group bacterium]|nr:FAD-binding oxidoreductase [FCB group bacterium]MBL7029199.1 FAD-binding oxidoreductase [Candidatus Neomarinimicrobiota bacterium]MBL7120503.1 FAD-binding oxidoreductase [Candidatus Neomarinimicrobiota bacterium]